MQCILSMKLIYKNYLVQSKNLQNYTAIVTVFHKNIVNDLITIDRKRKISPSDKYVEQENYNMKLTSAEILYFALYH